MDEVDAVDIEEILTCVVNDSLGVFELSADTEGLSVESEEREDEREMSDDFVDATVALDSPDGKVEIDNTGELVAVTLAVVVTANGDALTDDERVVREVEVATKLIVEIAVVENVSIFILVPIGVCVKNNDIDESADKLGVKEKMAEAVDTDEIKGDLDCNDVSVYIGVTLIEDRAERDKLGSDEKDPEVEGDRELAGEREEEKDEATVFEAETDFDGNVVAEGERDNAAVLELKAENESSLLTREETDALPERR